MAAPDLDRVLFEARMIGRTRGSLLTISTLLAFMLLTGCVAKRDAYDVPAIPMPEKFAQAPAVVDVTQATQPASTASGQPEDNRQADAGNAASSSASGTVATDATDTSPDTGARPSPDAQPVAASPLSASLPEWWRMLGSEELNHLVERALANNSDLNIATLRVAQLKARMEIAGAAGLPTLSLPVQSEIYYPEWGVGNPNNANRSRTLHQVSLRADWRPDLWGEAASQYDSAKFQLMRATFQRDDIQRTVVASLVGDYLEYLSLNDRLNVARETEKTLAELLEAVQVRVEVGDATVTDLEQQRAADHAVRATIPVLEQQRIVVMNRIAVTAGSLPEELKLSSYGMETVSYPDVLPGVPATLLLRRPDVRAVEARLLAADADIDLARSRLLPPLDLTAQAGVGSRFFSNLFSSPTVFWNIVSNLSVTLFDGGKRDKEVEFAKAMHEEMVQTYIRVIRDAVRETDDALAAVRNRSKQVEEQRIASEAAFRTWSYNLDSYEAGAVDYLVMLDSERSYHRQLDDLYRYRMDAFRGLVNLFSALGGGVTMDVKLPGKGNRPGALPQETDYGAVASGTGSTRKNAETADTLREGTPRLDATVASDAIAGRAPVKLPTPADTVEVAFTSAMPSVGQVEGIDWDGKSIRKWRGEWLVELFGAVDRSAIFPAWRNMRARFPQLLADRQLWPRRHDRVTNGERERESWYRLFISSYPDRKQAEAACAALRAGNQLCGAVSVSSLAGIEPYNAGRTLHDKEVAKSPDLPSSLLPAQAGASQVKPDAQPTGPEAEKEPIRSAIRDWAEAWSAGKEQEYFSAYSLDFIPEGMSKFEWIGQRRQALETRFQFGLSDILLLMQQDSQASASFVLELRYADRAERQARTLRMVKEDGKWRIGREFAEEAKEVVSSAPSSGDASSAGAPDGERESAWLVTLPAIKDQRVLDNAWKKLDAQFPGRMKVRNLHVHKLQQGAASADRYQSYIAGFPERRMAESFCGSLVSSGQQCGVVPAAEVPQHEKLEASWATGKGYFDNRPEGVQP